MRLSYIALIFCWYFNWFIRLKNKWPVILYMGKKGSGKTSILCKLMYQFAIKKPICKYFDFDDLRWHKDKWHIYCTEDIKGFQGYYTKFKLKDLGIKFKPLTPSILLCDEINLVWDNRNFKSFPEKTQEFFRMNRHYRSRVYLFSQTFDCDKKIRELTDKMVLVKSFLTIFSLQKDISKVIDISENKIEADSQVIDRLEFVPWWKPGSRRLIYLPKWILLQNSYEKIENEEIQKDIKQIIPINSVSVSK